MSRNNLFTPISIGNVKIKNRTAMAPMGAFGLVDSEGCFTQRGIDYYVERAKGDVGLIITSLTKVENELDKIKTGLIPCISQNPAKFGMTSAELVERCNSYGTKVFLQLSLGFGRSGAPAILDAPPVSASAIPNYWDPETTCRELTTEEVETLVEKTGEAAAIAKHAGYDGVEIHAMHEGYLLDQFTLSIFNRRTDKYGGDLRGRLRLPIEIVQEIKKKAGQDFPVVLRYSIKSCIKDWRQGGLPGEDYQEKGRTVEEGLKAAKILQEAGYDAFDADAGTYDAWYWAHPPLYQSDGCYLEFSEQLKEVVNVPVIVAGKMGNPEVAGKALDNDQADIIGLGRPLLTDPEWPKKVMNNDEESIRPCIGCHVGCLGRGFDGKPLCCAVNPAVGRERYYKIEPTTSPKKIMIIGGGVAGMEAARIAHLRGHNVTLYEKSEELGGNIIPGAIPDFKYEDKRLLEWYKHEINKLDIDVVLNSEVTEELINEEDPEAIIVATGSEVAKLDVPGIEKEHVLTAVELLNDVEKAGQNVVMIGGGLVGCETALYLARKGKNVTVVEMMDDILSKGKPVPHMNREMLIDLMNYYNIEVMTNNCLLEVTDEGAVLINNHYNKTSIKADTIGIASGFNSEQDLYEKLYAARSDVYMVGDAQEPSNIMDAIWSANEVALNI
ncbi:MULTISPECIES: FAD-dependent oxidoreductase [unclassified Halanaerobium]|uniref:oxidoreductase n=1 Tax=unclassified Halanaerobium TaxID=2641197 RepID=UPI000DF255AA|nr:MULTISPECIES: FAD-dependent oxidoreductase [unclassified Halanaerobium]RCW48729.1 2-enoate reductase [Halanaerobium sp. MA284_MarDTE_T2]RCW89071.1 2-enoate reductase [Halanaerobium sp. DL-01]